MINKNKNIRPSHLDVIANAMLGFIIASLPFLVITHVFFSDQDSRVLHLWGLAFEHGWMSDRMFVWQFLKALVPNILFMLFFFTSKGKWKYLILPVGLLFYFDFMLLLDIQHSDRFDIIFSVYGFMYLALYLGVLLLLDRVFRRLVFGPERVQLRTDEIVASIFSSRLDLELIGWARNRLEDFKSRKIEKDDLSSLFYSITRLQNIAFKQQLAHTKGILKYWVHIILLVLLLIFIWYAHEVVEDGVQELDFYFFKLGSYGFQDMDVFIWYLSSKIVILSFLFIWFSSSGHWWKYAILSPIAIYSYQFWECFYPDNKIEEFSNLSVLPITLFTLVLVILGSRLTYRKLEVDFLISELESLANEGVLFELMERSLLFRDGLAEELKADKEALRQLQTDIRAELDSL